MPSGRAIADARLGWRRHRPGNVHTTGSAAAGMLDRQTAAMGRRETLVPELSSQLLLDILLGFIVVLFALFGIRRGAGREALVSAGLLLAAVISGEWGERFGNWLAGRTGLDVGTARFAIELAILLSGVFVIGYGAGGAIPATRPSLWSRIAGGVLAAINGAVFLGYLLRAIDQNLNPGDTLDDGYVTGVLLNHFDLILLAAALFALLVILIGWIVRAINGDDVELEPAFPTRSRPVKVAPQPDAGKFDPIPTQPAAQPVQRVLSETAPLPQAAAPQWQAQAPSGNGNGAGQPLPAGSAASTWAQWGRNDPMERLTVVGGGGGRFCPTCGAAAGSNDLYCPECGKTL